MRKGFNFILYLGTRDLESSNIEHSILTTRITVNPRISSRGLICKNEFLGGGLFEGGLFQSLAFSSKVDIKNDILFSIN